MNRIDFSDVGFLLQADALERLRALPEHCVYVCVTSPPYYGLRDYGVKGQMGLEGAVPAYLAAMVRVFRKAAKKTGSSGAHRRADFRTFCGKSGITLHLFSL